MPPAGPRLLELPTALRRSVERHARAAYPEECCGVLVGSSSESAARVEELVPERNRWSGDRSRRYEIDPRRLLEIHRSARERGKAVVGYYHSHPTGEPSPSRFDLERAWPGASYLIAAVDPSGRVTLRSWRLAEGGGRLEEERLATGGGAEAVQSRR